VLPNRLSGTVRRHNRVNEALFPLKKGRSRVKGKESSDNNGPVKRITVRWSLGGGRASGKPGKHISSKGKNRKASKGTNAQAGKRRSWGSFLRPERPKLGKRTLRGRAWKTAIRSASKTRMAERKERGKGWTAPTKEYICRYLQKKGGKRR